MSKKTTNVSIDKAISVNNRITAFDRIVQEIIIDEIPTKYIENILVHYHDGNIVDVPGRDLVQSIPINEETDWDKMEVIFKKMSDVRIFLNTEKLEENVDDLVEELIGRYC